MPRLKSPGGIPLLRTSRLLLRPLALGDAEAVYRSFSDPEVARYLIEPLESLAEAEEVLRGLIERCETGKGIFWAVTLVESGEMIGSCGFEKFRNKRSGEVGFDLAPACWGKGLMAEALAEVITFGFTHLNLKEIYALTALDNRRALRLLKYLGFQATAEKEADIRLELKRDSWRLKPQP